MQSVFSGGGSLLVRVTAPALLLASTPLRTWRLAPALVAVLVVSACASIPPTAGTDARDPYEKVNRNVYAFNDAIDTHALRPVAEAYEKHVPQPVQSCIRNFFGNLADVPTALNEFLQGKFGNGVSDLCRVAINTTVGVLGCFDVARTMGLAKHDEDFGQTLGAWGVAPGPYLVLPLLGSSTVRDGLGRIADYRVQPQRAIKDDATYYSLSGVDLVDTRALLLPASRLIDQSICKGVAISCSTAIRPTIPRPHHRNMKTTIPLLPRLARVTRRAARNRPRAPANRPSPRATNRIRKRLTRRRRFPASRRTISCNRPSPIRSRRGPAD